MLYDSHVREYVAHILYHIYIYIYLSIIVQCFSILCDLISDVYDVFQAIRVVLSILFPLFNVNC